jgi:hypothetical protein
MKKIFLSFNHLVISDACSLSQGQTVSLVDQAAGRHQERNNRYQRCCSKRCSHPGRGAGARREPDT